MKCILKYSGMNKKPEKTNLTLFSLELLNMQVDKAVVFFDKKVNPIILLCFSLIRWNFAYFLFFFTWECNCW